MASRYAVLLVLAIAPSLILVGYTRLSTVFVSSDPGDDLFASKLESKVGKLLVKHCDPGTVAQGHNIIYVLDYNAFSNASHSCGSWPVGLGHFLLNLARNGSTVVLGYNTLRLIARFEPGVLSSLGISPIDSSSPGMLYIDVSSQLTDKGAERRLLYDASSYHRLVVLDHVGWRTLARFSDGLPAIAETRLGKGRIVLVFFNPVWPAISGDKSYLDLIVALHLYLLSEPTVPYGVGMLVASVAVASLVVTSSQRSDELARRLGKPVIVIIVTLGYRVSRENPLHHPLRVKILELANEKPFIRVGDVIELGVKRQTAIWHLEVLVSAGLLSSTRILGKRIYYKPERWREALLAFLLESKHRREILREISEAPRSITWLAERLGISKSTVKHHIDLLAEMEIVTRLGQGYTVAEWVKPVLRRLLSGDR